MVEYCSTTRAKLGTELSSQLCPLPAEAPATKFHRSVLNIRQCPTLGRGPKRGLRKEEMKGQPSTPRGLPRGQSGFETQISLV